MLDDSCDRTAVGRIRQFEKCSLRQCERLIDHASCRLLVFSGAKTYTWVCLGRRICIYKYIYIVQYSLTLLNHTINQTEPRNRI